MRPVYNGSMLTHDQLRVTRHEIPIDRLPQEFDGFRIAQISDLHFYERSDPAYYRRVADAVNTVNPDLIAVTGDIIHYGGEYIPNAEAFLATLCAPSRMAILGNHDYMDDAMGDGLRAMWTRLGIDLLVNEHRLIERDGARLWIAGVDDLWYGQPDLDAALDGVPADREPVILMAHNPLMFDPASYFRGGGHIDLVLAGHTHAGHVFIPVLGPIYRRVFRMKYRHGLYQQNASHLHVSSGTGSAAFYLKKQKFGLPRFRFNTWPEVAVLTLRPRSGL